MKPMDLFIANIPFDDNQGSKIRPALVININQNQVSVFKITSQYKHKSAKIRRLYYPIKNWEKAGLSKQSYIDTHKLYQLPKKAVFNRRPIGTLSDFDCLELFNFIKNQH